MAFYLFSTVFHSGRSINKILKNISTIHSMCRNKRLHNQNYINLIQGMNLTLKTKLNLDVECK